MEALADQRISSRCPTLIDFIQSIPQNLLSPYGDARYYDAPHLGCSFETSFHETGNLVNMVFIGPRRETVEKNGHSLLPEVHISILKDIWLRGGQTNITAEDIRRIAIGLAKDWDYYPSSLFLRAHQTKFQPARKSASRGYSSVRSGTSKSRCPTLISFVRRLPRSLIIPYEGGDKNDTSCDRGNVIRFYEDGSGCSFRMESLPTNKCITMIFEGPAMEAVVRSGQTFIPQVQIAISKDVWSLPGPQQKLKADDIRDLAVALASEWEHAPSTLEITPLWDPEAFFGNAGAYQTGRGKRSKGGSFNTTEDPEESIGSIQEEDISDSSF